MATIYSTDKEAHAAIEAMQGGWDEWTVGYTGENLGTLDAIITGCFVRRRTNEEKAQRQENLRGLWSAELDRHTPANGGRS